MERMLRLVLQKYVTAYSCGAAGLAGYYYSLGKGSLRDFIVLVAFMLITALLVYLSHYYSAKDVDNDAVEAVVRILLKSNVRHFTEFANLKVAHGDFRDCVCYVIAHWLETGRPLHTNYVEMPFTCAVTGLYEKFERQILLP